MAHKKPLQLRYTVRLQRPEAERLAKLVEENDHHAAQIFRRGLRREIVVLERKITNQSR